MINKTSAIITGFVFMSVCGITACNDSTLSGDINSGQPGKSPDPVSLMVFGGSEVDGVTDMISLKNGGFLVTGYSSSNDGDFAGSNKGGFDVFVMKFNATGQLEWNRSFGGSRNEYALSVIEVKEGGYVITGYTNSTDGDFFREKSGQLDVFVIKLTEAGFVEWAHAYYGNSLDYSSSIIETNDGGYAITGGTTSFDGIFEDFSGSSVGFLLKIDKKGQKEWIHKIGGTGGYDTGSAITRVSRGYVLTGSTQSFNSVNEQMNKYGVFVTKYNTHFEYEWTRVYEDLTPENFNITQISENGEGYLFTGWTETTDGGRDVFISSVDFFGERNWLRTFGGSNWDRSFAFTQTQSGEIVLTGLFSSLDGYFNGLNRGGQDIFVKKMDAAGNTVWLKTFGGTGNESGQAIIKTDDGSYIFAGNTSSGNGDFSGIKNSFGMDIFIMKLDNNGKRLRFN
ncbi:MAG: hypothetical protein EA359_14690 [Balneolaceae bacterium]|nr:MAG: hypothetical protein EA359_14690 [Balneolaceae bacterium]